MIRVMHDDEMKGVCFVEFIRISQAICPSRVVYMPKGSG